MPRQYGVEHGVIIEREVILRKDGQPFARPERNGSACRIEVPADGTQKGRLAGAIRPDDAIAIARQKFEIDLLKQCSFTELNIQTANCNHECFCFF